MHSRNSALSSLRQQKVTFVFSSITARDGYSFHFYYAAWANQIATPCKMLWCYHYTHRYFRGIRWAKSFAATRQRGCKWNASQEKVMPLWDFFLLKFQVNKYQTPKRIWKITLRCFSNMASTWKFAFLFRLKLFGLETHHHHLSKIPPGRSNCYKDHIS